MRQRMYAGSGLFLSRWLQIQHSLHITWPVFILYSTSCNCSWISPFIVLPECCFLYRLSDYILRNFLPDHRYSPVQVFPILYAWCLWPVLLFAHLSTFFTQTIFLPNTDIAVLFPSEMFTLWCIEMSLRFLVSFLKMFSLRLTWSSVNTAVDTLEFLFSHLPFR